MQKLNQILDIEVFVIITLLGVGAFLFYRFFLKEVSAERHESINSHLKVLLKTYFSLVIAYAAYWSVGSLASINLIFTGSRPSMYMGLLTFFIGALFFVKTCRLLVLQYLFLGSMRAGVPLLIVNIFTLLLSAVIALWTINALFAVNLTPLLATSAAFSIVLGLALQDTLGNLFAGIALQIDKTFEIGDWIEVMSGTTKITGQVVELSWRSTVLVGFSDELITLPNKLVAQCQVSNFSPQSRPIFRSILVKFPFSTDVDKAIGLLESAPASIEEILRIPGPFAFVQEVSDFGVVVKLVYAIRNYGRQYVVADQVYKSAFALLQKNGIEVARPSLNLHTMKEL